MILNKLLLFSNICGYDPDCQTCHRNKIRNIFFCKNIFFYDYSHAFWEGFLDSDLHWLSVMTEKCLAPNNASDIAKSSRNTDASIPNIATSWNVCILIILLTGGGVASVGGLFYDGYIW